MSSSRCHSLALSKEGVAAVQKIGKHSLQAAGVLHLKLPLITLILQTDYLVYNAYLPNPTFCHFFLFFFFENNFNIEDHKYLLKSPEFN